MCLCSFTPTAQLVCMRMEKYFYRTQKALLDCVMKREPSLQKYARCILYEINL